MAHPFLDEVQNIVSLGTDSVQTHRQEMSQLQAFADSLRAQEKAFLSQINFNGKKINSTADLNRIIAEIDKQMNIGSLLPRGKIEEELSKKYILSDTSKKSLSEQDRQIITAVMQKLADEGLKYIEHEITNSRASATRLSDIKNRLIAAIQSGITHSITITDKKSIVDPITIDPFLKEPNQTLDYAILDIQSNSIRGSQAASDFETKFKDDNRTIERIIIKTEATGKFIPLDKISENLSNYLLSIAKEVLGEQNYMAIIQNNEVQAMYTGPIPIGNASIDQLKQDTISIIKELVPSYAHVVDHFAEQIAIGRSISNIRGFLGEMRASLLMYALFGESGAMQLVSTGLHDKIRISENGQLQEAPIDFVVKALNEIYGFQVKNTIDTSYSWEGEMSAASFYIQRLQVTMTPEERDFYGAFSYNQPLDSKEVKGDWDDWDLYKRVTYPSFENNFNSVFASVFQSLAPNIIRLSTQTQGDNVGIFSGSSTLTNNFFIMQDKIIAASDIVQALINNQNIKTKFKMTAGTDKMWTYGEPARIDYRANSTKIEYNVTLNYKTLFKSAYNMS